MKKLNRRDAIKTGSLAAISASMITNTNSAQEAKRQEPERVVQRGRMNQSVARWCYRNMSLDDLCRAASAIGLEAIDLLSADEWETARRHNLKCAIGNTPGSAIPDGLNRKEFHDKIVDGFRQTIPLAVKAGVPNLITFFGNRRGMSDAEAIDNCVIGLNRIKPIAEDAGVTVCVELLNSKVDHKDYQGDNTAFGAEVMRRVGSPRVKLLYDIYHMQIMEGDVIRTIKDNHQYIGHYHTGGVPGRHEIDQTQELHYPAICQAILDTGYKGYLAHEFIPQRDPVKSLREAAILCDI